MSFYHQSISQLQLKISQGSQQHQLDHPTAVLWRLRPRARGPRRRARVVPPAAEADGRAAAGSPLRWAGGIGGRRG